MKNLFNSLIFGTLLLSFSFVMAPQASANDYSKWNVVSETYLRTQFKFDAADTLKYSGCKKKSYPTCTYVWGVASDKDASRAKYGLEPQGKKLEVIYAQGKSAKDFDRVLTTYSDAAPVAGVGIKAVWSEKRKQLSLITKTHLIVHVHMEFKGSFDRKAKAKTIAKYVLGKI